MAVISPVTAPPMPAAFRFALILALSALTGCYSSTGPAEGDTAEQERLWTQTPVDTRIRALRQVLRDACPQADALEIADVAGVTVRYGELLAESYDLSRPPEYHNIAVRLGMKKRGLCFQLADDLYVRLRGMELQSLDLHQAITQQGHLTEEHNCVIITERGKPMESGVVLDLWRYAGKARFVPVAKDHHEWTRRPVAPPPPTLVIDDTRPPAAKTDPPKQLANDSR